MILKKERSNVLDFHVPIYIFALALILAATFFLLLLDRFKTYQTQISVLFIPQNEKIAVQANQITENLTVIPTKLSFYDKLISDNRNIKDKFAGKDKDERKELWNKTVKIKRDKKSTIITIDAQDKTQSQEITKQTAVTLFDVMSRYYNIKTDVDFRIIDGPNTQAEINNWPVLVLISLALGLILALLVNIFSKNIAVLIQKEPDNLPERTSQLRDYSWEVKREIIREQPIIPQAATKKAEAPVNLPTSDEYQVPEGSIKNIYSIEKMDVGETERIKEPVSQKEPTEEELKERLNQLLRGQS